MPSLASATQWYGILPIALALIGLGFYLGRRRSPGTGVASANSPSPVADLVATVLDVMGDCVLVADLSGQLIYLNRAARKALSMEDVALPVSVATSLSDCPGLVQLLLGAEVSVDAARQLEVGQGRSRRSYEMSLTELLVPQGGLKSRMVVLSDVTDLEDAVEKLRLSEDSLRHVINLFPHRIYARDRDGKFLMANAVSASSYGVEPDELVGRTLFEVEKSSERAAELLEQDRRIIASGERHYSQDTVKGYWGRDVVLESTKMPFQFPATGEPAVLGVAVDVTERIRTKERIRALAFYDSLTGLPNRRRFRRLLCRSLERSRRTKARFALLFVDLDRFKDVNDRLGHHNGDQLLSAVGERLRESVRPTDNLGYTAKSEGSMSRRTPALSEADSQSQRDDELDADYAGGTPESVSRLAGDEFTILLTDVGEPSNAAQVANRIIESISRPFLVSGHEVFITASIGIALYPDDGLGAEALLHCADQAMHQAKRTGPKRYAFFDASMNAVAARRLNIQEHLRHAIDTNELRVVYQQIRNAATGQISGSEALLRWDSAALGPVEPSEFIPIAEQCGLIADIGRWVLREACRQQASWFAEGLLPPRVAINVSAAQLQLPDFAKDARTIVREAGLSPDSIEFELTETAILRQDHQTNDTLSELADMGVRLSLDDFGTGQSSLSYLRRFAFSRIKIDRSFVSEIPGNKDDSSLTAAIISMAHELHLSVVAEGVETEEQLAFLRERKCDELQGYLFARPESPEAFAAHLERTKAERSDSH